MVTSQSYDEAITSGTMYIDDNQIQQAPLQYTVVGASDSQRISQLEKDLDTVRGILVELYNKCPKTKTTRGEKRNKADDIECENCGGVLW